MLRKAQYLVFCLLLGLAFSSCSRLARSEPVRENGESDAKAGADKALTVAVARIEREDWSQGLTLAAEFRPFQETDRSRHHGPVRALLHPWKRHRTHRVPLVTRRQPDQSLFPARYRF